MSSFHSDLCHSIRAATSTSNDRPIYLHEPFISTQDVKQSVCSCIDSGWFSTNGSLVSVVESLILYNNYCWQP